ncbi:MAG: hypothetical protein Q8Q60_03270 [Candidatus Chromulinivorax sp.]|nr:hypothetical protein [Candidatus Chromulinivorax sp.]
MKKTLLFLVCSCIAVLLQANNDGFNCLIDLSQKYTYHQYQRHVAYILSMTAKGTKSSYQPYHKRALSPKSVISVDRIEQNEEFHQMNKRRVSFSDENNNSQKLISRLTIRRPISVADSFSNLQDCDVDIEGDPSPATPVKDAENDCVVKTPSPAPTPTTNDTCLRLRSYSSESNAGGYFLKSVSTDPFDTVHVSPATPIRRKYMGQKSYSYGSNDELRNIGIRKSHRSQELQDDPTPTLVPSPSPRK